MAKHAIEPRRCSTFGTDAHARPTAVKGIDGSTGATAIKRFDDVPAPSGVASASIMIGTSMRLSEKIGVTVL